MWDMYWSDAEWDPFKCITNPKVDKDLASHPFNNVMSSYADWAAHMSNHLIGCNQGYGKLLHWIQRVKQPLTYAVLRGTQIPGLQVDLIHLARSLWTFIYGHVTLSAKR